MVFKWCLFVCMGHVRCDVGGDCEDIAMTVVSSLPVAAVVNELCGVGITASVAFAHDQDGYNGQ